MRRLVLTVLAAALITTPAFSEDKPSKKDREKMAEIHEQMADCLKSDKDIANCHDEMRASCDEMGDACPMHKMGMKMDKKMGKRKAAKQKANN